MASSSGPILLVVGLGNPGPRYDPTRHNAGFWFCDALAARYGERFAEDPRHQALVAKLPAGALGPGSAPVWLLKPQTFMNASGESVGAFARFYRLEAEALLVAHDELDIPPGEIRLKKGGGHAGHNGLRSIDLHLGSPAYWRLRLGIGHPRALGLQQGVADFVLHRPSATEQPLINSALDRVLETHRTLLADPLAAQKILHAPSAAPAATTPTPSTSKD